ncbi:MAG: transposase [Firmicutes bacterium]|nr:transposase [Dethiobacter sp.]MBS3888182.1 transposase [Bacillota bacterium]MBS4054432.1 transposase [Thermaerobacter sp.]
MPRQARRVNPQGYYHVMMRGNNRHPIFGRPDDKAYYLKVLQEHCCEDTLAIVAYCLMDNHVHLVLHAASDAFSRALSRTNLKFALRYNTRQKHCGHVFQDRFRSEIIDEPRYLLAAIRYVHNNPVKAKLVNAPRDYRWSSYQEYVSESTIIDKELMVSVLAEYFNGDVSKFIAFHRQHDEHEFLEDRVDLELQRLERGQRVLLAFCESYGIENPKEAYRNPELLATLTHYLIENSRLSHRQVAELLGVSSSRIHRVASRQ